MPRPIFAKLREFGILRMDSRSAKELENHLSRLLAHLDEPDQDQHWVAERKRYLGEDWDDDFFLLSEIVESPIEQILGGYLLTITNGYVEVGFDCFPGAFSDPDWATYFRCQQVVYDYRVDFLFKTTLRGDYRILVVECDGHDFHDRTKMQASRDRSRDRRLKREGIEVVRFTGSEIYYQPEAYAAEVESQLARAAWQLLYEHGIETKPRNPFIPD
jgi:very-short-patch-repair endonuclease